MVHINKTHFPKVQMYVSGSKYGICRNSIFEILKIVTLKKTIFCVGAKIYKIYLLYKKKTIKNCNQRFSFVFIKNFLPPDRWNPL